MKLKWMGHDGSKKNRPVICLMKDSKGYSHHLRDLGVYKRIQ